MARARYQDPKTVRYFESERGRNFIRSTLRRTRLVETLVDRWLAAHPDHQPLPHLEDDAPSALDNPQAQANAALDATDPGAIPGGQAHDARDGAHAGEDADAGEDRDAAADAGEGDAAGIPATATPSGGKRRS